MPKKAKKQVSKSATKRVAMLTKTIKTGAVEVVKTPEVKPKAKIDPTTFDFPEHTKFIANATLYTVRSAFRDSNTDFRKLYSDNNEEIMTLVTVRDIASTASDFVIVG